MSTVKSSIDSSAFALSGVILAAGSGRRMGATGERLPKVLLPVNGGTVLSHQVHLMQSLGVHRVYLVVRHLKEMIAKYTKDHLCRPNLQIVLLEQESGRYGIGAALQCVEAELHTPFVLFLGDIFLMPAKLPRLVAAVRNRNSDAVVAVSWENNPAMLARNFSVELDRDGLVRRVVEKPKAIGAGLKGCGIYCFNHRIFDALRVTAMEGGELGLTQAIQTLIDSGGRVRAAMVSRWDVNLTTPADVELCNEYLRAEYQDRRRHKRGEIGSFVYPHDGNETTRGNESPEQIVGRV